MIPDNKILKDAQYRKGLSIAFFNATNAAISLIGDDALNIIKYGGDEALKKKVTEIRNWLLEEHKEYYATVIANVGSNYKIEDSLKKLKSIKNIVELTQVWQSFSADERGDDVLIKEVQDLKIKLAKKK